MTRLLVDAGNTRVKWALDAGGAPGRGGALERGTDPGAAVETLLASAGPGISSAILVDTTGTLAGPLARRVETRVLVATRRACGVVNAYPEPGRLGADRWAAMIGALRLMGGPCCVVSAGTALTADLLAADGRHAGGWIATGLRSAVAALARDTSVRVAFAAGADPAPAADTEAAVNAGVRLAAHGFVGLALAAATAQWGPATALLVTGGDAEELVAAFPGSRHLPDLVLRGAAAWAAA